MEQPADNPTFAQCFDSFIAKVDEALYTSSKVAANDYIALEKMNKAATVYYKNHGTKLASIAQQTKDICETTRSASLPSKTLNEIWEKAHRMEAIVDALDQYTSRLEAELTSGVEASGQ